MLVDYIDDLTPVTRSNADDDSSGRWRCINVTPGAIFNNMV